MAAFTRDTPWGRADHTEDMGQGIMSVSTSSHGGIFVPLELLDKIPPEGRAFAKRWGGSEQWYEEDCAWAYVALAFPELFSEPNRDAARRTMDWITTKARDHATQAS
jgi:hypothetical protein